MTSTVLLLYFLQKNCFVAITFVFVLFLKPVCTFSVCLVISIEIISQTFSFSGYLNNEEATISTIDKDGWLHTGDIVYFDQDGYLYLFDRLKEFIKYKGFQVSNFLFIKILW